MIRKHLNSERPGNFLSADPSKQTLKVHTMRAVVQLVSKASVKVSGRTTGKISNGLVVLLGVSREDEEKDVKYLADKISTLRIFPDEKGLMNRSVLDVTGEILVVSQFTLFGDCRKGRRPSYSKAASPEIAQKLYLLFIAELEKRKITVATGEFQAMMKLSLTNDGPVTILVDSAKIF